MMTERYHIQHELSDSDWRRFYHTYYAADRRFKLRFIYGTAAWIIGVFGLVGLFDNKLLAFGMIAFGLYCVFAKQFLINKALKKLQREAQFPALIDYRLDDRKISGTDRGLEFEFPWKDFFGYRDVAPGLMFYLKASAFFFIPQEALKSGDKEGIIAILQANQVPDLGR